MPFYESIVQPIQRMLSHPVHQLTRWQRRGRFVIDLVRHCWRELMEDRAEEMAAALTYRTIFSLVPLLVLGLVIFRAFVGLGDIQKTVQSAMFDFLGVPRVPQVETGYDQPVVVQNKSPEQEIHEEKQQQAQEKSGRPPTAGEQHQKHQQQQQVRASIRKALSGLVRKLSNLSFTSIGVVGVVVLIYAAMMLAWSVEWDFDVIFKSPRGRPWHLRIMIYWTVVTLGSGLLAASLVLSSNFVDWIRSQHVVYGPLLVLLSRCFAFLASWIMLFLLYYLLPNTRVRMRPAIIGSLVAALLWEIGKVSFQAYTGRFLPYSALYGTLGLIPLFLLWVYISWMIALFGLELTYTLQMLRGRRWIERIEQRDQPQSLLDPRWLIPMMTMVGQAFEHGTTITLEQMAERTAMPVRAVTWLVEQAVDNGLLHHVAAGEEQEDPGYTLSRPPDQIHIRQLLELGRNLTMDQQAMHQAPGRTMLEALSRAEHRIADHVTLAAVLHHTTDEHDDGAPGVPLTQPGSAGGENIAPDNCSRDLS